VKVVFDTNTIVSALLFTKGQLSWLRHYWSIQNITSLASNATVDELIRVLAYPKFQLEADEINILLAEFVPYVTVVKVTARKNNPRCRDPGDQIFVDLAISGSADVLVTGDKALLAMNLPCKIITPREFKELVT
jgi:putative PIN family toxin of toxin-antitoxin system